MNKGMLMLIVVGMVAVLAAGAYAAAQWRCCFSPGCDECRRDTLGCNCALREKLGMQPCGECQMHGCGSGQHDHDAMHAT